VRARSRRHRPAAIGGIGVCPIGLDEDIERLGYARVTFSKISLAFLVARLFRGDFLENI
jgi:hypothetical protein